LAKERDPIFLAPLSNTDQCRTSVPEHNIPHHHSQRDLGMVEKRYTNPWVDVSRRNRLLLRLLRYRL